MSLKLRLLVLLNQIKTMRALNYIIGNYFVDEKDNRVGPSELLNMILIPGLTPVTKPYYFGWKNGVIVEYEGRTVKVTSGMTDYYRELFASKEMAELLEKGELFVEITGMELTSDSIRHPVFLKKI